MCAEDSFYFWGAALTGPLQPGAVAPVAADIKKWKNLITIYMNKWCIQPFPPPN